MAEVILNLLPVTESEKKEFQQIAPEATHWYARRSTVTPEQLAQATILFGWPRPSDLQRAPNLKWFQTMWAGSDEYIHAIPEGVLLTSSSGSNKRSVAEHMLSCTLALCRRLPQYRDSQRAAVWQDEGPMKSLFQSTVLVLGTGNIGSLYGSMCQKLGAYTIGVKRRVTQPVEGFDELFSMEQLDFLLPRADVVALILPHSPQTEGLMTWERLSLLKDDAILLNCGRGSVLDHDALAALMQGGKLWGAALDVTQPEPLPQDSPLWQIPNLLITPHVAGGMRLEHTRRACIELAQENLRRFQAGEPLKNLVFPAPEATC